MSTAQQAARPGEPVAETGLAALFQLRNARVYFPGSVLSLFGDNILTLAAGVWIKTLTGNDGAAGLATFFLYVPTLFSQFFGVLADRYRRRSMMLAINAVMMAATPTLLFVHGRGQIWLIYLVLLMQGFAVIALAAASSGMYVEMFPGPLLASANGLATSLQEGLKVIAPTVGAALFLWVGGGGVGLIDAVSYVGAFASLSLIRVADRTPARSSDGIRAGMASGMRYILDHADLRRATLAACAVTATGGFLVSALYGVLDTNLHRSPAFLGVVVGAQGVGSVIGGLLTGRLAGRWGPGRLTSAGVGSIAAGSALLLVPELFGVLAGNALRGVGNAWMLVGVITLMQRRTPRDMIGRASSALYLLVFFPTAASALFGAGLIQFLGFRTLIAVAAATAAAACALSWPRHAEAGASDDAGDEP